ncbi:MAG: hypothetical protein J6J87_05565 [Oscillospiraceae bacterium]|nr:hypothetical protein [Oscillospiraceae bacterium]
MNDSGKWNGIFEKWVLWAKISLPIAPGWTYEIGVSTLQLKVPHLKKTQFVPLLAPIPGAFAALTKIFIAYVFLSTDFWGYLEIRCRMVHSVMFPLRGW